MCMGLILIIIVFLLLNNRQHEDFYDVADLIRELGTGITNVQSGIKNIVDKIPPTTPLGSGPPAGTSAEEEADPEVINN